MKIPKRLAGRLEEGLIDEVIGQLMSGTEAITGELALQKEGIYCGRAVKLEGEVRDASVRYSKRPGKKVVKDAN